MLLLTLLILMNLDFVFYNWTNIVKGCLIGDNDILDQQNSSSGNMWANVIPLLKINWGNKNPSLEYYYPNIFPYLGFKVVQCYPTNWGLTGAIKTHGWGITVPI